MVLQIALFYPHKDVCRLSGREVFNNALVGAQLYEVFENALAQILNRKE